MDQREFAEMLFLVERAMPRENDGFSAGYSAALVDIYRRGWNHFRNKEAQKEEGQ